MVCKSRKKKKLFENVYDTFIKDYYDNEHDKTKCYQTGHDFFFLNEILSLIFEISPLIFSKVPVESGKFSNGI